MIQSIPKHRPQVLLLGNGINQSYGGVSWGDFLSAIATKEEIINGTVSIKDLKCPEPLKAILVTNDHIDVALKEYWETYQPKDETPPDIYQQILSCGFDDILTTNYTYELEQAALYPEKATKTRIKKMMHHTGGSKKAESKYLLHTYNKAVIGTYTNRIWHIHGEARKPDSTILGHYYYGNLLYKIKDELKDKRYDSIVEGNSWVDSFILGDIYVLGFGFGLSEFDLWWLLNRKAREKTNTGKVYFYEPTPLGFNEKQQLMRLLRRNSDGEPLVHLLDCGFKMIKTKTNTGNEQEKLDGDYLSFYNAVLEDIKTKMQNGEK